MDVEDRINIHIAELNSLIDILEKGIDYDNTMANLNAQIQLMKDEIYLAANLKYSKIDYIQNIVKLEAITLKLVAEIEKYLINRQRKQLDDTITVYRDTLLEIYKSRKIKASKSKNTKKQKPAAAANESNNNSNSNSKYDKSKTRKNNKKQKTNGKRTRKAPVVSKNTLNVGLNTQPQIKIIQEQNLDPETLISLPVLAYNRNSCFFDSLMVALFINTPIFYDMFFNQSINPAFQEEMKGKIDYINFEAEDIPRINAVRNALKATVDSMFNIGENNFDATYIRQVIRDVFKYKMVEYVSIIRNRVETKYKPVLSVLQKYRNIEQNELVDFVDTRYGTVDVTTSTLFKLFNLPFKSQGVFNGEFVDAGSLTNLINPEKTILPYKIFFNMFDIPLYSVTNSKYYNYPDNIRENSQNYKLKSIIVGPAGHYTCYIKYNGLWYFYNDTSRRIVPVEPINTDTKTLLSRIEKNIVVVIYTLI